MRLAIRLGLFALVLRAAFAQSQPNAAEILKKVSETYQAVSQYEVVTETAERGPNASSSHMRLALKSPNKYRMEGTISGLSGDAAAFGESIVICDGFTVWFYLQKSNQYASFPLSVLSSDDSGDLGDLRPEVADEFVMLRYRRASALIEGSKVLREETMEFAGTKVDCYVVAIPEKIGLSASTWWVDKRSYRVLREDSRDSSIVFTSIKLNEALPDNLFRFTPPPGARKLEMPR